MGNCGCIKKANKPKLILVSIIINIKDNWGSKYYQ